MSHEIDVREPARHEDRTRSRERGMTLVEVLVALTLLATAFLGLAAVFPLALGGVATGGVRTAATLLARESLERARHTAYDRLPSLDTGGLVPVPGHDGFLRGIGVASGTPTARTTTVTVVVHAAAAGGPGLDATLAGVLAE